MRIPKREKISGKNLKALRQKQVEHMQKRYARLKAQEKKIVVDSQPASK